MKSFFVLKTDAQLCVMFLDKTMQLSTKKIKGKQKIAIQEKLRALTICQNCPARLISS